MARVVTRRPRAFGPRCRARPGENLFLDVKGPEGRLWRKPVEDSWSSWIPKGGSSTMLCTRKEGSHGTAQWECARGKG